MASRSPGAGNGSPFSSNSTWFHPAPNPRSSRPPASWSRVAAILASSVGGRNPTARTRVPSRTVRVRVARAARVVQHSGVPMRRGGPP
jgi:hypothetical protein